MKFLAMFLLLTAGCGTKKFTTESNTAAKFKNGPGADSTLLESGSQIKCTASKYQNSAWGELATFSSPSEPSVNNGELSQSAEFTSDDNIAFSAAGNFDEGLLYFGSIYDLNHRVGSQIQLVKKESLDLYLLRGSFEEAVQYAMHCDFVKK